MAGHSDVRPGRRRTLNDPQNVPALLCHYGRGSLLAGPSTDCPPAGHWNVRPLQRIYDMWSRLPPRYPRNQMLEEGLFDPAKPLQIRQGDLPHWRQDGALYFVTFRLSDSLPQVLLEKWRRELEEWRREHEEAGHESLMQHSLEQQRHIERWLDRGYGSRILADPQAKQIVTDTICHFNGDRYELGDFVVAANHVHVLLRMAFAVELSDVLYSWKRFSSTALRRMAWVRRAFDAYEHLWQAESFDHIVRNSRSLDKISQYIRRHNESEAW